MVGSQKKLLENGNIFQNLQIIFLIKLNYVYLQAKHPAII